MRCVFKIGGTSRRTDLVSEIYDRITKKLTAAEPVVKGMRLAAVSMIISDEDRPSVLLIRRAERRGDPWSGQIAFPGGKMQPGDGTPLRTAVRETDEEVGIDLSTSSSFIGYGQVATTHTGTMEVVPVAFLLRSEVGVTPNEEVASYLWADLRELAGSRTTYSLDVGDKAVQMPAFQVEDYVVWGLTHRILSSAMEG